MKKVHLDESKLSNQITSNTTFHLYFLKEIVLAHFQNLFGRSNRDAFWENEDKIHKGGCVKEIFFVNLQVGISQLHYEVTSSQIILRDFK